MVKRKLLRGNLAAPPHELLVHAWRRSNCATSVVHRVRGVVWVGTFFILL